MECITPPALTDEQIFIFLDAASDELAANGDEDAARVEMAAIAEHLAHCPPCAARAVELRQTERALTTALYRIDCPPSQSLGEFQLGLLSGPAQAAIAEHLKVCVHCRQEVAQLSDFMAMDALPQPAEQPAKGSPAWSERTTGSIRLLIATLVDSLGNVLSPPTPALAGLRGQEASQQVFQADHLQIILDIQPETTPSDQYAIYGLILGLEVEPGAQVAAWCDAAFVQQVDVDELGNFIISALPQGLYELILNSGRTEIHMPTVAIG